MPYSSQRKKLDTQASDTSRPTVTPPTQDIKQIIENASHEILPEDLPEPIDTTDSSGLDVLIYEFFR